MNPRRLYRSRDRQLAGVAGGMAEYLEVDPTVIRIAWIVITILSWGLALIAYLLLALVIPNSPYAMGAAPLAGASWASQPDANWSGQPGAAWASQPGTTWGGQSAPAGAWSGNQAYGSGGWAVPPTAAPSAPSAQWNPQWNPSRFEPARQTRGLGAAGIVGIVLVVIGAIALLDVVLPGLRVGLALGPAVILAIGAALLLSSIRRPIEPSPMASTATAAPIPTTPYAEAAAHPASSVVPADMTPWPTTAAPARPVESQVPQPEAGTSAETAYSSDETKVDPI